MGWGLTVMINDYLLLNIIDISFLLRTSGPSGNRVTGATLWASLEGCIPHPSPRPALQYLKIWETPSSFATTILVSLLQKRFSSQTFSFLCQPLRIGVAQSEQTSCYLRIWCIWCEWLLNIPNSWQSQILNSMRKSRPLSVTSPSLQSYKERSSDMNKNGVESWTHNVASQNWRYEARDVKLL